MAKWLKDYLTFGSKRIPPQPPKPDYKESDILKAYRAQKSLYFEDPYENLETKTKVESEQGIPGSPLRTGGVEVKYVSPKHRLIKVDSTDLNRSKIPSTTEEITSKQEQVAPNSEYSDPFDFQNRSQVETTEENKPEYNGYMEPYEAQRGLTDLHRKGEKKQRKATRDRKGVQLYDIPYEENSGDSEPECAIWQKTRESRLPQDDERPADEYDQPWEWKKDHISKAFAVQFESQDWDRPSSPTRDCLKQQRHISSRMGPTKYSKPQTMEHSTTVGEKVNPTVPLENQVWYHGTISRADAEGLLTLCKESSYLVRNSETSRNDYSLSIRSSQGFMHMKFTKTKDNKYILGQNSAPFDSIPEVINFYTSKKLPVKGAEHLSLLYPVAVQTL